MRDDADLKRVEFQSTPPCGGDSKKILPFLEDRFQSTPPCGGDKMLQTV